MQKKNYKKQTRVKKKIQFLPVKQDGQRNTKNGWRRVKIKFRAQERGNTKKIKTKRIKQKIYTKKYNKKLSLRTGAEKKKTTEN